MAHDYNIPYLQGLISWQYSVYMQYSVYVQNSVYMQYY